MVTVVTVVRVLNVVRGFIPDGSRSGPPILISKSGGLLRSPSGINPLATGVFSLHNGFVQSINKGHP